MVVFTINEPPRSKEYLKRDGAYGLMLDKCGLLAVVQTKTGYFLPGGGIEADESAEACLIRECIEEIGVKVSVKEKFAIGTYYFYSTTLNRDMASIGHFYRCEIVDILNNQSEPDHKLVWLEPAEAVKSLYLKNQKRAVKILLDT